MITEVVMPTMGADMTEGTVVKWLKAEGDEVARGDILAEIETDKTVVEMEAYGNGLLRRIVIGEGVKVPVGELIAYIADAADALPETTAPAAVRTDGASAGAAAAGGSTPAPAITTPPPVGAGLAAPPGAAPAPVAAGRVKASPLARKIATERGIDLAQMTGTGPGGRITRADVEGFVPPPPAPSEAPAAAPAAPAAGDVPLSSMRQAIARVTLRSKTEQPHYYINMSIDMTEAMRLRQGLNEEIGEAGPRISVNDMIVRASVKALQRYPKFNSTFAGDSLQVHADINMGIAIALEAGLIVPAILRTQDMSLGEIAEATRSLAGRVRGEGGALSAEESTGATFSISNMGMFGVDSFTAIIVPPQAAILAVGTVTKTPVVRDGEIVVRDMMGATLSADHRVSDGAEGGVFLGEVRRLLENPVSLLV